VIDKDTLQSRKNRDTIAKILVEVALGTKYIEWISCVGNVDKSTEISMKIVNQPIDGAYIEQGESK
jgi:hypothetical protein